jgi:hypothetical protein
MQREAGGIFDPNLIGLLRGLVSDRVTNSATEQP